jgi:histidinol phosphatase-like PHP family hydrolase
MVPFPIIPLYAETHFKFFRFFPSLLYKKFPEVIFDLPRRLEPGLDLPIVLLLNDIDRFPVECLEVKITVSHNDTAPVLFQFVDLQNNIIEHPFSFQSHVFVFSLPRNNLKNRLCHINCSAIIKKGKRIHTIINDNLTTSSKLPFSCFIANESFPGHKSLSYGDLHVHSHFSQSHAEFGPPVQIIDLFAKCYGADFIAITDHSYDLACSMNNYLMPDSELRRWKLLKEETSRKDLKSTILLGEEISCLNSYKKAIHLCGLGMHDYIHGTIDGARKNVHFNQQLSIEEAIALLHKQEGVAFAAHPGSKMGFMQRLFLHRGMWRNKDISYNLDGIQAINSGFGITWQRAKALWIKELLKGKKISLIAGTDSHGDFNRYRFLSVPFISIKETFDRHFCSAMTGTYEKVTGKKQLIEILKNGRTFVTTGPMLCLSASNAISESIIGKNDYTFGKDSIIAILLSNEEFGAPRCLRIFWGNCSHGKEKLFFINYPKNEGFTAWIEVSISTIKNQKGYLRAEAECQGNDGVIHYSATSPVYF